MVPCAEVVKTSFYIPLFAGKLVVIGIVVGELKFAAPGIIIRFSFDVARSISHNRSRLEMVGEVIKHSSCAVHTVSARNTLSSKKHILARRGSRKIGFGHDPRCHVPIECATGGV